VIGAPYASGILVTGPGPNARYRYQPAPADIQEKAGRIQAVCQRHGASLAAAALQFPLAHPAVVAVIPGGAKPEEVTSNLGYFAESVPAQVWADLKSEGLIDADAPTPA
jgi:D-threo-aldose 1-dehydrogenase